MLPEVSLVIGQIGPSEIFYPSFSLELVSVVGCLLCHLNAALSFSVLTRGFFIVHITYLRSFIHSSVHLLTLILLPFQSS